MSGRLRRPWWQTQDDDTYYRALAWAEKVPAHRVARWAAWLRVDGVGATTVLAMIRGRANRMEDRPL